MQMQALVFFLVFDFLIHKVYCNNFLLYLCCRNRTIMIIIAVMMTFVLALSIGAQIVTNRDFNNLWYLGYSVSENSSWPYLLNLQPPNWVDKANNLLQNMFLFTTLLNNFVPLSLYVTMELVTRALMMLINTDLVSNIYSV